MRVDRLARILMLLLVVAGIPAPFAAPCPAGPSRAMHCCGRERNGACCRPAADGSRACTCRHSIDKCGESRQHAVATVAPIRIVPLACAPGLNVPRLAPGESFEPDRPVAAHAPDREDPPPRA